MYANMLPSNILHVLYGSGINVSCVSVLQTKHVAEPVINGESPTQASLPFPPLRRNRCLGTKLDLVQDSTLIRMVSC